MLTDACDGTAGEHTETIVQWCDDVTDVVERVRSVLETVIDPDDLTFEPVNLSATVLAELARVERTYPDVTFERDIDEDVTVHCDELLAEVVGNILMKAVEHNETEDLRVTISVERDSPVRVRIADNGAGVSDEEKDAIFRRGQTGHAK